MFYSVFMNSGIHTSMPYTLRESYDDGEDEERCGGRGAPPWPLHPLLIHTCRTTSFTGCFSSPLVLEYIYKHTHLLMKRWCSRWSELCVYSALLRRCKCTCLSVPLGPACGSGGIHWPGGAVPGPVQRDPPTGSSCACSLSRIAGWLWARWMRQRSRWGWNCGVWVGRCRGWTARDPLPGLSLKESQYTHFCFNISKKIKSVNGNNVITWIQAPWFFQEAVHTWALSADMKEQK